MAERITKLRAAKLPIGFRAAGISSGIKDSGAKDLGIVISDFPTVSAATFTTNRIKAAPVRLSKRHLSSGDIRAVIVNSGNANACNGRQGLNDAKLMAQSAASSLGLEPRQVFVCSTGIIGYPLPVAKVQVATPKIVEKLRISGWGDFSRSIMTSDKVNKVCAVKTLIGGKEITITGTAKGSGMIAPNMATMLAFFVTDAAISEADLRETTKRVVNETFNCISIDGDMSTNDTVLVLANGTAKNRRPRKRSKDLKHFSEALNNVMLDLSKQLVRDGEGASKFIRIEVEGASSDLDAKKVARAVAKSSLVKCSWNGSDPNWGRVIDAVGYSGARVDENKVDIYFGSLAAAVNGIVAPTPIGKLKAQVAKKEFTLRIDLNIGKGYHRVFTSDLSEEYVAYNRLEYALKIQGR
ncbi:MAG: bifunctional glutamate N-acetyltransferase/amino-acid acetyltransferase ArgJ [Verrucomicrobiota bacterium]|nr:bifunctional glutamate N-acetyltransferase/amino-acid acetyltransferase ArgJ [Verrucomicrobiota bacterium]MED6298997.1 bifunctional glutamate N-acetyltransferase/amino-acid acetyltransferase ArgJ [Verrucomicrobiota bacterium]MEE3176992.1 bifunctional glutamate N-acetyltransferase/amino-acid acetyltransferase ArgJ [Verrucomicrobiota bacterium]